MSPPSAARKNSKNPRPEWLTIRLTAANSPTVDNCLQSLRLHTVCVEAGCPNRAECFGKGYATFMLLGDICTRHCGYCAVKTGSPPPIDATEPERVAQGAARLNLRHIVITSVTRDDLPDGGAAHFARTVAAARKHLPAATVEILVPDFNGNETAWTISVSEIPDVYNHNLETVERLFPTLRPQGNFARSLSQLAFIKKNNPQLVTKSGIMVGLGEDFTEIIATANRLRENGVEIVTIGQYLPPRTNNFPVVRYLSPAEFAEIHCQLRPLGFRSIACSPLTRSSYHAEDTFAAARKSDQSANDENFISHIR